MATSLNITKIGRNVAVVMETVVIDGILDNSVAMGSPVRITKAKG